MPIAPRLVAELNAQHPGAVRRGDAPLVHGGGAQQRLATGVAALDLALDGGLPRGQLSELVGPASTGLTSLVQRLLGHVTAQENVAAWIDAPDAFDPASAVAAGVDLERLLWVRPPDLATAFTATEALLGMGGFPLVLLDASVTPRPVVRPPEGPRFVPDAGRGRRRGAYGGDRMATALQTWMRLARAAARSSSALVVLRQTSRRRVRGGAAEVSAGSSAAVRLELQPLRVMWDRSGTALLDGLVAQIVVQRNRGGRGGESRVVLELA